MGTAQLISKVEKLSGEERVAVLSILEARNQDISKWRIGAAAPAEKVVFEDEEPLTKEQEKQLSGAEKLQKQLDKADKALKKPAKAEKAPKEPKVKKEKVVKEKKEKVAKVKKEKVAKEPKTAPAEGSISAKVLELLKAGELSKYKIAKECKTHYSVVVFVEKHYLDKKAESAPDTAIDQAADETPAES
jgi:uncharacterized protein (DUF342 family)